MMTTDSTQPMNPYLQAARAAARQQRAIGYVSDDIPVELILAADALPVRLSGIAQPTPNADPYLESSFGPASRSLLEQWLQGELDFLDAIVFPRSNDTAQRLYYYVCELQRRGVRQGPRTLIFDVARIERDTSRRHTLAAVRKLAMQLGTEERTLTAAASRIEARASLLDELTAQRLTPQAVAGSVLFNAWRRVQSDWTQAFDSSVRNELTAATRIDNRTRVLIAGSTPPDERFHVAVERAGGNVVDEFFDEAPAHAAWRWATPGRTLEAIARTYGEARNTAQTLLRDPDVLVERARRCGATGVVLWFVEQDEGIVWEVPRQLERLHQEGLRTLSLTRQAWNADAQVLDEIDAFVRTLRDAS